jgi:hypothetical protein
MSRARALAAIVTLVLLSGCTSSWPAFHHGPDRTGYQPYETTVGTGNVANLHKVRTYPNVRTDPVVVNGVLYVAGGSLYAYDATGATRCAGAPATPCTPLWSAPLPLAASGLTVSGGRVYVAAGNTGMYVYDAAGVTGCTTTAGTKTCAPLWSTYQPTGFYTAGSPLVVNGIVYVAGAGNGIPLTNGGALVSAFDAAGSTNCGGAPKVCTPLWTTIGQPASTGGATDSPTVVNGVLYIGANRTLFAFDANGGQGCDGPAPNVCSPLWTAPHSSALSASPVVANGMVYVVADNGPLSAYDAAGVQRCSGTPKTCAPLWTANVPGTATVAVGKGMLYQVSQGGMLSVFDADASTGCDSATPKVCVPLWTAHQNLTGYSTGSSPAVANGLVYYVDQAGRFGAFDAAGTINCGGAPKVCTPLWSVNEGVVSSGSPTIVNGVLYETSSVVSTVYAYSL